MNENKEMTFFTIGCGSCGGLQLGGYEHDSMETIPVFRSRILAEMALSEGWQSDVEAVEHPPKIIEIKVTITS